MNTFTFESGTKSFLYKVFFVGVLVFALGVLFNSIGGSGSDKHDNHNDHGAKHSMVAPHNKSSNTDVFNQLTASNDEMGAGDAHHAEKPGLKKIIVANVYTIILLAFWVGIAALFFLSAATLALGAWQVQIQKTIFAVAGTLPFSILMLAVFFLFFNHDIFEWTHHYLYEQGSPTYDPILASKQDYLNITRFGITAVILFAITLGLYFVWYKNLKAQEDAPSIKNFDRARAISAISIVLIAMVLNTFGSWDWAMSIQPHWYSTMFSWYSMASAAVTMFSIVMLLIIFLQSKGYLPRVNENHRHDIGKFMFAISVFWTYVWFSQYMLIWYANIPEETIYFSKRLENYPVLFYGALLINFILPFLILLRRESKRNINIVAVMAFVIIFGHWIDFFSFVVPEIVPSGGFGFIGFGALLMIASVFVYLILLTLSKFEDLESSTHPYIKESYQHHI